MFERDCPDGLNAEPLGGRIQVYGPFASLTMSPEAALWTADRLRLAAEEVIERAKPPEPLSEGPTMTRTPPERKC